MKFSQNAENMVESHGSTSLNMVGRGTSIKGDLKASSSVRVDGDVRGKIDCEDLVTIGSTGSVDGDVKAKNIVVGGKCNGNLYAQEKLVLESKSVVKGEIVAKRLVVDEGAIFDGACGMTDGKSDGGKVGKPAKTNEKDKLEVGA